MRFFLDNCLAIRHARALNALLTPDHEFIHLQEKFEKDIKDVDWLSKLGEEGEWIIISGDYRIGKSAHEKAAWHASGLTVFFLGKGWMNIPLKLQHSKLTETLDEIIELAETSKPGSGFMISVNCKIRQEYSP
jgi:hypothetical protein